MNYGKKHDLPFGIMDVAGLLRLNIRRRAPGQVYVDCPICGDRRGKMNLNTAKDLWRCNYCGEGGGMLSLYAKVYGVSNSDAYREICDALAVNGFSPDYTVPEKAAPAEAEQSDAASVQEVHQTLSMLLSMLTLIPAHHTHLQSVRGLSDDEITRFGFKSTPPPFLCRSLTNRLVKAGCRVQGVPGFYVDDNGCWTVKFHQRTSGIIIPIFGVDGLIHGAQIRLDHPLKDKDDPPEKTGVKYLTLSSTGKRMGTTSGSPIHFVGDPCSRVVYVTEGCLKADVAHALMHRTFVATLGVNNTAKLDELFAFLHRNGTEEIIEAEDMDKYRFVMGKNVTPEANCASNGFHCAENPLDCLSYYGDMNRSIYCLVQPGGDIDEDDRDSKIACTELTILRQLTKKEFFLHALAYMVDHPGRKVSDKVQREHSTSRNGYAIVRGKEPAACGKLGDILAFARERRETEVICQIAVVEVDGEKILPDVWYDIDFVKREAVQK